VNKALAIIPARGGSKRVKGKNIKILNGKPLISYSIEVALQSSMIDRVVVSTDDEEIARVAKDFGAEVPFMRPSELAGDDVPDLPVLAHALEALLDIDGYQPDVVLFLRPTSPFKTTEMIKRVISKFNTLGVDIVRTMTKSEGVHHPYWMYQLLENNIAEQFLKEVNINDFYQSQLLPPVYRINGAVDAYSVQKILSGDILTGKINAVITSERESIDIDTDFDFELCELMMKLANEN